MANANTFEKNPEVRKKATEASKTPAAKAKAAATRKANALIKSEVYSALKQKLLQSDSKGKAYFEQFIDKFLAEAKKNPAGRCGATVAGAIFTEDILSLLDEEQEKRMARDLDFTRFRLIKHLFRQQRDVVLDTDKRKKCICCSRRAGKTDMAASLCDYVAVTPNSPVLYINLKFSNAIDQLYKLVKERAEESGLIITEESKADGYINFSNGSSIAFGGNNNSGEADKYRGGKYRLIIVDEAGHQRNMKYLVEDVLQPMLADFKDSIIIAQGTPPRVPHTYFEKCWNNPSWQSYHWTMLDNPYLPDPEQVIEDVCKEKGLTKDSPLIQREYYGKMGIYDTEAMVFKDRKYIEKIDINNLDFEPTNICLGVDFGYNDYNGIVTLAYNKNTRQSLPILFSKFNKSTIQGIVDVIVDQVETAKKLAIKYGIDLSTIEVFCDNNEKSIVAELARNYGLNAHTCWKYDKKMAIEQLAEELRTGRMRVEKGCSIDDEMDQIIYKRDEDDHILPELDEDLGIHPDIVMALLYASRQMFMDYGYTTGGRSKDEVV